MQVKTKSNAMEAMEAIDLQRIFDSRRTSDRQR